MGTVPDYRAAKLDSRMPVAGAPEIVVNFCESCQQNGAEVSGGKCSGDAVGRRGNPKINLILGRCRLPIASWPRMSLEESQMTTRRDFLNGTTAAATGIVFCGCGMLEAAHARHPGGRRLPVAVNGKRIKTIDVHAHCYFRESTSLVGPESIFRPPTDATRDSFIEIESRLKAMDAQAVDMEVLSINPFWYDKDRDLAGQIVKIQNEKSPEAIK
jgi:hypothetical protein